MNDAQREAVLHALWPEGTKSKLGVWAVLDGARDPRIHLALLESRLEFRSLYSGRLPRALEMVAPQLVELLPGHRFTQRLLDEGFGNAWGILLKIDDPANLRHHLRKFLKVQAEDGQRLLFRFYDPRVLGPFLRSCDGEQLASLFGPVHSYWAENTASGALDEFRLVRGALAVKSWAVPVTA